MKVWLDIHHSEDALMATIRHDDCVIDSMAAVGEWKRQLVEELKKLGGEKAYLLVDMGGFVLDPVYASEYGETAKRVVVDHALAVLRYGSSDGMTLSAVRLEAVIHRFPANTFADRTAALAALDRIRDGEKKSA